MSLSLKPLSDRAFLVPAFLNPSECEILIGLAEAAGFVAAGVRIAGGQKAMPQVRNNARTLVPDAAWVGRIWQRLSELPLPRLGGEAAAGLPRDLRFYKYAPGQRFKMHKDGPWHEGGLSSQLTFLVYLNDDFGGGATDFRDFQVAPVTGHALLFIHDTWHEGAAVSEGTKYVLRSDVLYGPAGHAPP